MTDKISCEKWLCFWNCEEFWKINAEGSKSNDLFSCLLRYHEQFICLESSYSESKSVSCMMIMVEAMIVLKHLMRYFTDIMISQSQLVKQPKFLMILKDILALSLTDIFTNLNIIRYNFGGGEQLIFTTAICIVFSYCRSCCNNDGQLYIFRWPMVSTM